MRNDFISNQLSSLTHFTNNAATSYVWTTSTVSPGNNPLFGIRGALLHVKALFAPGMAQTITFIFQSVTVTYNVTPRQISCNGVSNNLVTVGGVIQLEIIVDRNTIEIFGNNGQLYMPLPADNPVSTALLAVTSSGGNARFSSLTVNKLKSIWTGATK